MKLTPLFTVFCLAVSLNLAVAVPTATVVTPVPFSGVSSLTSISITFSESVTGVDVNDLFINGDPGTSVSGSGVGPYVFSFAQPSGNTVSVEWAAATGITGASGAFVGSSWRYGIGAPIIFNITPTPSSTLASLTTVSVTFNQIVTNLNVGDLEIGGQAPSSVTGSGVGPYLFSFTQPSPGTVAVTWDSDHGIAGVGTGAFVPTGSWSYTLTDTLAPTIGKISTAVAGQEMSAVLPTAGATISALTQASVTFSEIVTGVNASDLLINGVPATSMTGDGAGAYLFIFPAPADGAVTFSWAAGHGIIDSVGNAFGPTGWSVNKVPSLGSIIISEFLAANGGGLGVTGKRDENFDTSGWIELFNAGATSVDLTGWSLSNDYSPATPGNLAVWNNPRQWIFPARTLAAGARLVLWASGKDRKPAAAAPNPHLHTNFSLDTGGGSLGLFPPNTPISTPVSSFILYPAQRYDYSYGVQSTDNAVRYFFPATITQAAYTLPTSGNPTPAAPVIPLGAANGTSTLTSVTPNPNASVKRGFFNEPFSLLLTCTEPTAVIRYTLNGSVPTAISTAYSTPLNITATTVLRFAAFGTNLVPSETITQSYLFLDNVANQPNPPYDNPANTFDSAFPQPPSVGGQALPVAWGSNGTFTAAQTLGGVTLVSGGTGLNNLTAGQVPADYGMDPKITADPNKYNDLGAIDPNGKTNLDRIKQGLRELPMLSLVLKIEDMFGDGAQGLSTSGGIYPTSSAGDKTDRTKAASLELLMPDGSTGFAVNCGIDNHGNASRDPFKNPKHGFTLRFKGLYGAGKLQADLFPDSPVKSWDKMVLRADFNSSWRHQSGTSGIAVNNDGYQRPRDIRCRDAYAKDTFRDMGHLAGHHRYVNLFINGIYWGSYDLAEDQAEDFGSSYLGGGGSKDNFDAIDQGTLKSGDWISYYALKDLIGWTGATRGTAPTAAVFNTPFTNTNYESLKSLLDVPEFIDYMLHHWYTGHRDWATTTDYNKNWYMIRAKNGKWQALPWDQENLLWHEGEDRVTAMTNYAAGTSPTLYPPAAVHPRVKVNAEYRLDCADRIHKFCVAPDGALTPAAMIARLDKWTNIVNANAMCLESARWGDYRYKVHSYSGPTLTETYSWNGTWYETGTSRYNTGVTAGTLGSYNSGMTNNWRAEVNRMRTIYFPARTNNLLTQLRTNLLYPTLNAPQLRDNSTDAVVASRTIPSGWMLKMTLTTPADVGTTSAGTIYYTLDGNDPRVPYDTTGVRTATALAYSVPIPLNATTTVKARCLNGTTWSALNEATFTLGVPLPKIVISEINYNPRNNQGGSAMEFVEIQNNGPTEVDLGNWYLTGVDFVFPYGTMLGAGDRLVVASNDNPSLFATNYPGVLVAGNFGGSLSNGGERLSVFNRLGQLIFSVEYGNVAPWPAPPNNGGFSLELANLSGDPQTAGNWRASTILRGTPGRSNSVAGLAPTVFVSEFSASSGINSDFVELLNPGLTPVDISDWSLRVSSSGGSHDGVLDFIGTQSIPAGTRLIVQCTPQTVSGWSIPVSLERSHGVITLVRNDGTPVDSVRYGPQALGYSFGRTSANAAWQLGLATPAAVNNVAPTAAVSQLRFNEWLANPAAGADDWLELYNLDGINPVVLTGLVFEKNGEFFPINVPGVIGKLFQARLYCNNGAQRGDAVALQLPSEGATIRLRDANNTILDTLTYGIQATDTAWGRLPNGTGAASVLTYPSPDVTNVVAPGAVPLLNEVLVINHANDIAPWAHRPAWIELKNTSGSTLNLADFGLRNAGGVIWKFPATSLVNGAFLTVWADAFYTQPTTQLNCGLRLDQPDTLELLNPLGQIVDRVQWGTQIADQTIGRLADNSWALLLSPTRGNPNAIAATLAPSSGLKINEWLQDIGGTAPQFVEIFNPSPNPVSTTGLWLGDEPSELGRRKWQAPKLSFIGPQGFGYYQTKDNYSPSSVDPSFVAPPNARTAQTINFSLSPNGEYLRLSQNDGSTSAIDSFNYGLNQGGSTGRIPDGTATIQTLTPTPGFSNSPGSTGPVLFEQPISIVRTLGETARLRVIANYTATAFQWQRNGINIASANSQQFDIANVALSDDADYTCLVTSATGSTTSQAAHLTVLYTLSNWAQNLSITTGPNDDSDLDGLSNQIEFLLGTDPLASASPAVRDDFLKAGQLETTLTQSLFSLDLRLSSHTVYSSLTGELSSDLATWITTAPTSTTLLSTEANGDKKVRLKFAQPVSQPRSFLKLKLVP